MTSLGEALAGLADAFLGRSKAPPTGAVLEWRCEKCGGTVTRRPDAADVPRTCGKCGGKMRGPVGRESRLAPWLWTSSDAFESSGDCVWCRVCGRFIGPDEDHAH